MESKLLSLTDPSSCPMIGERWIVMTTASFDPITARKIASTKDWKFMMIGERKARRRWSTSFSSPNFIFLSFEDLSRLDFLLVQYLTRGINAEKNIAFLIAIFCGAKIIYELDSAGVVWNPNIIVYPSVQNSTDLPWIAFQSETSSFVNIYGIFGQPQIWPRGIPLDELRRISENGWSSLRRNEEKVTKVYIQQNIFDSDPDVDALVRLKHPMFTINVRFDHDRGPIALDPFIYSPYNSQNTIHHYEALWGLYLPVKVDHYLSDILRGYWVQRLLWEIDGKLLFSLTNEKRYRTGNITLSEIGKEKLLHNSTKKLVLFLNSWNSKAPTIKQKFQDLIIHMENAGLIENLEAEIMLNWLDDLSRIDYRFPSLNTNVPAGKLPARIKRAAVCLTGLAECVNEVWMPNEIKLRERIGGEVDVFLFLSSGPRTRRTIPSSLHESRVKQARFYNSTVNIIRDDTLDLDPGFPKDCQYRYEFTEKQKVIPIEQERFAQARCYKIVKEFEKQRNTRYELFVRARSDLVMTRLPRTFERTGKFDVTTAIIVPDEHHYYGINDRFAIGPMDSMQHYMYRWHQLSMCRTSNVHPESFLSYVLQSSGIRITKDRGISLAQIPHGNFQCH